MKLMTSLLLMSLLLIGACGSAQKCAKPRAYQEAVPGQRIETLDGMDPLPAEQEMSIPSASPDAPPPPGDCIDSPPTLRTGGDEG